MAMPTQVGSDMTTPLIGRYVTSVLDSVEVSRGLLSDGRESPERRSWGVAVIRMKPETSDKNYVSSELFVKLGFAHTAASSRIWVCQ